MSGASRRDTLATLAGFLAVPALATGATAGAHPDAAILAHAPRLAALKAEMDRLCAALYRANDVLDAMRAAAGTQDGDRDAADARWSRLKADSGYDAAQDAFEYAVEDLIEALDAIAEIPARTLDGLCLKARYSGEYERLADSIIDDLRAMLPAD